MNKTQLIAKVAEQTDLTKKDVTTVLDATLESIQLALRAGETVQLTGFGNFEVRFRNARRGRNPLTGEEIEIAAAKIPAFRAGKTLRASVQ